MRPLFSSPTGERMFFRRNLRRPLSFRRPGTFPHSRFGGCGALAGYVLRDKGETLPMFSSPFGGFLAELLGPRLISCERLGGRGDTPPAFAPLCRFFTEFLRHLWFGGGCLRGRGEIPPLFSSPLGGKLFSLSCFGLCGSAVARFFRLGSVSQRGHGAADAPLLGTS